MHSLSDHLLLSSYKKAAQLKLNDDFLALMEKEMKRRGIQSQKRNKQE
ncbi:sporulation histidine kinase inhibitor Sda [Domibacillus iocasae]|uniref:Check point factor coupling initiation of sporulation and replication initiation n=1 Tax=Domibacillus iocasae TaxID=1714016 RepID=A0A1E7DML2_9BACI|nr:sporulation histidine kinase inhibitor Sda [Domibacillus iocasae]OES44299.1 check point factor coupling initiation of sporulation and replication initiation [Domibacillus iocasae]